MRFIIIAITVAAACYFIYINKGSIEKNVDKSIKQSQQQMQGEKTIKAVSSGRKRVADDVENILKY
jgi:uncharacterized protein YoxC